MNYYVLKDNVETKCIYGVIATKVDSDTFNNEIVDIVTYLNNHTMNWMIDDLLDKLPQKWEYEFIDISKIKNIYI